MKRLIATIGMAVMLMGAGAGVANADPTHPYPYMKESGIKPLNRFIPKIDMFGDFMICHKSVITERIFVCDGKYRP